MAAAIIILVLLGLMDLMLFLGCVELEREEEERRKRWKNEQTELHRRTKL